MPQKFIVVEQLIRWGSVPGPGTTGNTVHGLLLLHIPADNTVHQQVPWCREMHGLPF